MRISRDELSSDELFARLRAGETNLIEELYRTLRKPFFVWAGRRYPNLSSDDLADAFQDAIVSLYENISSGKLTTLNASIQTIVFSFGERKCMRTARNSWRAVNVSHPSGIKGMETPESGAEPMLNSLAEELSEDPFGLAEDAEEQSQRQALMKRALKQLSIDCQRLLADFYYEGQTLALLAEANGHRDVKVTASRKSFCLSRLRTLCNV
jgi:DNA-directed RNA polymerase specialized sigma24 family protein